MNRLALTCLATILCLGWQLTAAPAWAQSDLNGVWEIVEAFGHNTEGDWTWDNVQPSLYLFQDGYYSITYVAGNEARPLMADDATREELTAEQAASVWIPYVSNAGTYEVSESTLTTKPMVSLWPNFMEGGSATYTYSMEKDMLTLSREGDGWTWTGKLRRIH